MAFDTWESYFYPPPDEGTLRNLFDERDPVVLTRLEYVETCLLYTSPSPRDRTSTRMPSSA